MYLPLYRSSPLPRGRWIREVHRSNHLRPWPRDSGYGQRQQSFPLELPKCCLLFWDSCYDDWWASIRHTVDETERCRSLVVKTCCTGKRPSWIEWCPPILLYSWLETYSWGGGNINKTTRRGYMWNESTCSDQCNATGMDCRNGHALCVFLTPKCAFSYMSNNVFSIVYFHFISKVGHISPSTIGGRTFCIFYAILGIPLMLVMLAGIGEKLRHLSEQLDQKIGLCPKSPKLGRALGVGFILTLGVVLFLLIPGIIFKYVEGWTYGESLYYGVITLTTIGFGDFVAGKWSQQLLKLYVRRFPYSMLQA